MFFDFYLFVTQHPGQADQGEHAEMLQPHHELLLLRPQLHHCGGPGQSHVLSLLSGHYLLSQEEETGILTGLADYVRSVAPHALLMPSDQYDHYYKPPWATSPDLEQKHRDISQDIGVSLKGNRIHNVFIGKSLDHSI